MKKALGLGLGLSAGLFIFSAINGWALSIDSINVTGATNASGPITVSANISNVVGSGLVSFQATSADGLSRRYFHPTPITGSSWNNTNWNPYFTGNFIVDITAFDQSGPPPARASTTVTVTRAVFGTVNSVKYSSVPYDANGVWSNVDINAVKFHDIGLRQGPGGAATIGCNLLNANPTITPDMGDEAREVALTDTGAYKPAGTPYRFDFSLHARPRGFMGMGEIKRWIWTPADTNNLNANGSLVVDITAVSPWRSSFSNALQAHVGMAPIFAMTDEFNMPTGMIMCTSAHYRDVGPTNTGTWAKPRPGLRVDGHTGTNSYLKTFFSDTALQQRFGLTNVYDATNILTGFVQHFDTNDAPIDTTAETTVSFTRIEGGTNILYDYDADGLGDSGYEVRFDFEFHSAVAAQMGAKSTAAGPRIKANGTRSNLIVNYPNPVTITVEMNASTYVGAPVDWWVVASANLSEWFYLNSGLQWTPFSGEMTALQPVYQGALVNLSSRTVLDSRLLPAGTYYFWFVVDYPMDGVLDLDGQYLSDKVTVEVQ